MPSETRKFEVTVSGRRVQVDGSIGGNRFWVNADKLTKTLNVPATGDIDAAQFDDLLDIIKLAATVAEIEL